MEAKDTVMGDNIRVTIIDNSANFEILAENIAQAQAPISFKAGQAEGYHEGFDDGVKDGYKTGHCTATMEIQGALYGQMAHERKTGIKEVVEWLTENNIEPWVFSKPDGSESHPISIKLGFETWQAKLKEWGIE